MGEDKKTYFPNVFLFLIIGILIIHIIVSLIVGFSFDLGCVEYIIQYGSISNILFSLYFISPAIFLGSLNKIFLKRNSKNEIIKISVLFAIYILTNISFSLAYYITASHCGAVIHDIVPLIFWNIGSIGLFFVSFILVNYTCTYSKNKISQNKKEDINNIKKGEEND